MTKYRSLLFREFRINRKNLIIFYISTLVFYLFLLISGLAFNDMAEKDAGLVAVVEMMPTFNLFLLIMPVLAETSSFLSDINTGWLRYSYALPVSPVERTAVLVGYSLITQTAGMLIGLISVFTLTLFTGTAFEAWYIVFAFICMAIALLTKIITGLFIFRARTNEEYRALYNKAGLTNMALMFLVCIIGLKIIGFDFEKIAENNDESLSFDFLSALTPDMLFRIIPLILVLIAGYSAVVYYRLCSAYSGKITLKKKTEKASAITVQHSEPIGFLRKELKQNRNNFIFAAGIPFFVLLFFTMNLSLVFLIDGELNGVNGDSVIEVLTSDAFRITSVILSFFMVSGFTLAVFHGDDRKLWAYFVASTPNGIKRFLYTKYVMSFAMCGIYFVSAYFADALTATLHWFETGVEAMPLTEILVLIFFGLLLINSVSIPLMLRFGEKKGMVINLIVLMAVATAAVVTLVLLPEEIGEQVFMWLSGFMTGEHSDLTILMLGLFPFVSVGAYMLSYKVSCKIFMKGADGYDK